MEWDIRKTAAKLQKKYENEYWFQCVAIAEPDTIYIFLKHYLPKSVIKKRRWRKFNIKWQYTGPAKPC